MRTISQALHLIDQLKISFLCLEIINQFVMTANCILLYQLLVIYGNVAFLISWYIPSFIHHRFLECSICWDCWEYVTNWTFQVDVFSCNAFCGVCFWKAHYKYLIYNNNDVTWHYVTWHGMTWHDVTWRGITLHDETLRDMTIKLTIMRDVPRLSHDCL